MDVVIPGESCLFEAEGNILIRFDGKEREMFRAEDYIKVDSLAEAYELCQKRSSLVVGGMVWLKMTHITKRTILDLSGLELDKIEENSGEFRIGAMSTLRQLETHEGLNRYFNGIFKECTRNIVGVQMRNCATVGGSVFARFGFSDILTAMMALDTYVELYHGGVVSLAEFAARPVRRDEKDILVRIIIKKDGRKAAYAAQRNSKTDFAVLACCVSLRGNDWYVSIGSRPARAQVVKITDDGYDSLAKIAGEAADSFTFSSNIRGSGEYRRSLAAVYTRRLMERLTKITALSGGEMPHKCS